MIMFKEWMDGGNGNDVYPVHIIIIGGSFIK